MTAIMDKIQFEYQRFIYEIAPEKEGYVRVVHSVGLFSTQSRYGDYDSGFQEDVVRIPEFVLYNGKEYKVFSIEKSILDHAINLRELHIPRYVSKIEWCFWDCPNLESIVVDGKNSTYCDKNGVLYSKNGEILVAYPNKHGKEYKVESGTRIIRKFAFKNCEVSGIEIPSSLEEIQTNAFYRCLSLKYVSARGTRWPLVIDKLVGDYGDVNPLFHYSFFSIRMGSPLHNRDYAFLQPSNGTVVNKLKGERLLISIDYLEHRYYGVCDSEQKWLLRPVFDKITIHNNLFIEALIESEGYYLNKEGKLAIWFDSDGNKISKKQIIQITDSLVYYCLKDPRFSDYKGHLYTDKGEKILDSVDGIRECDGFIFVTKGERIGLYDHTGTELIPVAYNSIECVSFYPSGSRHRSGRYRDYSFSRPFDTVGSPINEQDKFLIKRDGGLFSDRGIIIGGVGMPWECGFDYPFILDSEKKTLFTLKTGIVRNCCFYDIIPITLELYAVFNGSNYGVYDLTSQELIFPCGYERIQYYGNNVFLVCKEGLWGASSIKTANGLGEQNVSISPAYYEIKVLNEDCSLFGVKRKNEWWAKVEYGYTIVDAKGEIYKNMGVFWDLDSQLTYFSDDRVLTSRDNKYGFVSVEGFVAIPFKYDGIRLRSDGNFLVRIGPREGVLSTDGREIVPVKYLYVRDYSKEHDAYNSNNNDRIVEDAESGGYGVLNTDGTELVPPLYDLVFGKYNLWFYTREKQSSDNIITNWFSAEKWGAIDEKGNVFTPPIYRCFERDGKWLLGATSASTDVDDQDNWFLTDKVFDLYDLESGQKVLGGILGFEKTENKDIMILHVPASHKVTDEEGKVVADFSRYAKTFWILVNIRTLESVMQIDDGEKYQFRLGDDIYCILPSKEGDKCTFSHPEALFLDKKPVVSGNCATIIKRDGTIEKQAILNTESLNKHTHFSTDP